MEPDEECPLTPALLVRLAVLSGGACIYAAYTTANMASGRDARDVREFLSMFFLIGAQQGCGGLLLGAFSVLHSYVHERGLSAMAWYSANFDFETVLTLGYTLALRRILAAPFFAAASYRLDAHLELGKVLTESKRFSWRFFASQFTFVVLVVGVWSRILSMATIVLLSFAPLDPLRLLAVFYYHLPLPCGELAALLLYAKPAVVDGITFIATECILGGGRKLRCAYAPLTDALV